MPNIAVQMVGLKRMTRVDRCLWICEKRYNISGNDSNFTPNAISRF